MVDLRKQSPLHQILPFVLFLAVAAVHTIPCCVADDLADGVVDWVRGAEGGYFNEKLEIRRADPADESSPLGVFAKANVEPHETLMRIPQELYIQLDGADIRNMDVDDADEAMEAYVENLCLLAKKFMKEMKLGDESQYGPYVRYLNNQRMGAGLPASWSKEGKSLLREVLPEGSDGVDWIDWQYRGSCFAMSDPFEEHVVALTKARCYDTSLIPIWDMVNHDNGQLNTENTSMHDKDGIRVWASRAIQAGEEVFATYDDCVDCMGISDYWGTTEILRDFGFVENYPHRFVYTEEGLWWEVWEGKDGSKEVRWDDYGIENESVSNADDYDYDGSPDAKGINFLRSELDRINHLSPDLYDCSLNTDVPAFECAVTAQYKAAATEALSLAIKDAEHRLRDKDEL